MTLRRRFRRVRPDALILVAVLVASGLMYSAPAPRPSSQAIPGSSSGSDRTSVSLLTGTPATTAGAPAGYYPPAGLTGAVQRASGAPTVGAPQPSPSPSPAPRAPQRVRKAVADPTVAPAATRAAVARSTAPRSSTRPLTAPDTAVAVRATFYCAPPRWTRCTRGYPAGSMVAAISPDLRSWTGRLVRACHSDKCVVVRIVDCDCATEHGIDLYGEPFSRLAPLSVGVLTVTLEVVG